MFLVPWVAFQDSLSQGQHCSRVVTNSIFQLFHRLASWHPYKLREGFPELCGCAASLWVLRPFAPEFLHPNSSISLSPPQALKTLKLSAWLFHVFALFTGFVSYLLYLFIICFCMFLVCCLYPFYMFVYMLSPKSWWTVEQNSPSPSTIFYHLPFKSDRPGAVYPLGGWDLLPEPSTPESTQRKACRQKETLRKKRSMERLGALRGEFQKCLKIQKPSFSVAKKIWNLGTWTNRNSPGGCLSEDFRSDGGKILRFVRKQSSKVSLPTRITSQLTWSSILIYTLQIVLEAETGGPMEEEAPNLEIFMQLKHQGV